MPRGIPNVKRDETVGMKHSLFHIPLSLNPKQQGSSYLRSETQSLWARNAMQQRLAPPAPREEGRKGSKVIIIDPGSRNLRIGRASDINPVSVPNCIARRIDGPVSAPRYVETLTRSRKLMRSTPAKDGTTNGDIVNGDREASSPPQDPFEMCMDVIRKTLRGRMDFYKLRVTPDAGNKASAFNAQSQPEIIPEENDPYRVEFITNPAGKDFFVGEDALLLADPQKSGYTLRYPIMGNKFNTRDYPTNQMIFDDLDTIIATTLNDKLGIDRKDFKNHSVILVIPNFYERSYLQEFAQLLMVTMGFKQMCAQQDSLAAAYGAGVSTACVVNVGATSVSMACVEDGMVVPETRLHLGFGGDSVTELLHVLLDKVSFPYKDIDLSRSYDWRVMEELKFKLCTLQEHDVALNLYDFVVRAPGKDAEKYGLRAYDEVILAAMALFEPRILDHDRRKVGLRSLHHPDVTEDVYDTRENMEGFNPERVSNAMVISTNHLIVMQNQRIAAQNAQRQVVDLTTDSTELTVAPNGTSAQSMDVDAAGTAEPSNSNTIALADPSPSLDIPQIDIPHEASQLPLDVAIYNCCRGTDNELRLKKWLSSVLLVGGTSLIPGISHQIESRLQSIVQGHHPDMRGVTMVPAPKDVDPRVLVWKGASVLGKMDGVSDLWLTASDWDILGMRGLRERCFFL